VILSNPASELELPRKGVQLPREVLNEREVEVVLGQPDTSDRYGVRDRTMMEVLYSTGIRRRELAELGLYDIDAVRGTLMVRSGKGNKDRVVPIGERALAWVDKYVREARGDLVTLPDCGVMFLSRFGEGISLTSLSQKVREYIKSANVGKTGSCHLFRHTMATMMLERGADIRFIQEMLGHADISSTQLYTRVSIKRLQEVHAATHPSAKLDRPPLAKTTGKPGKQTPKLTPEDVLNQLHEEADTEQEEAS
jgi:integrase/recombinase XerD